MCAQYGQLARRLSSRTGSAGQLTPNERFQRTRCGEIRGEIRCRKSGPGRSGGCPPELPQSRACTSRAPGSSLMTSLRCATGCGPLAVWVGRSVAPVERLRRVRPTATQGRLRRVSATQGPATQGHPTSIGAIASWATSGRVVSRVRPSNARDIS